MILLLYHVFFISASVVAGVMNTNKLFPFMGMSEAPSSDLNSIQTPGMYYLAEASKYTNAPGFGWCSFIVFKTLYVTQIAFQSTGNQTMSRVFDGNVWSAWQHLDNFGYNSLAELATGVAGQIGISYNTFVIPVNEIVKVSSNICGLFVFRIGTYSAVVNFSNWIRTDGVVVSGDFSVTKDTDGKCNIYSENSALYLQNLTDTEVTVKSVSIGL